MPNRNASQLYQKFIPAVVGFGLFCVMLISIRSLMWGSRALPVVVSAGLVVVLTILNLDDRFWLVPCFLFSYSDRIPVIKFTGMELGSIVLAATYFVRFALRREERPRFHLGLLALSLPFLCWMLLIWFMYPTGMLILGSSSFGGRFYFKVLLAYLSLFIFSAIKIGEKDSRSLFFALTAGILLNTALRCISRDEMVELVSGTHYQFIPLTFLASLILCRYPPHEILARFWTLVSFVAVFGLTFYSGNRTAAARPVLVALLVPLLTRRNRVKTFGLGVIAGIVLAIVVVGHGSVWNLPFAVQRPLSVLPGRWDPRLERYGFRDDFRAELRRIAREHIDASPWFGDGGFSLDANMMMWSHAESYTDSFFGHVVARNWHNVWLGMAADFGIPLSVAWALFTAGILWFGYRNYPKTAPRSWNETMYLFFYLMLVIGFINSFFDGGHTSTTSAQWLTWAGLLIAVLNGASQRSANSTEVSL